MGRGAARGADRRPGRGQARAAVTTAVALTAVAGTRGPAAGRGADAGRGARCRPAGVRQTVLDGGPEVTAVLGGSSPGPRPGLARTAAAPPRSSVPCSPAPHRRAAACRPQRPGARDRAHARRRAQQPADRARLGVTVNTVKWYLKNIFSKLDVANRAEAVSAARRGGLVARSERGVQGVLEARRRASKAPR